MEIRPTDKPCRVCGEKFPTTSYFAGGGICRACFEKLTPQQRLEVARDITQSLGDEYAPRARKGFRISCPICGFDRFRIDEAILVDRKGLLPTMLDVNYCVCGNCGYMMMFSTED